MNILDKIQHEALAVRREELAIRRSKAYRKILEADNPSDLSRWREEWLDLDVKYRTITRTNNDD